MRSALFGAIAALCVSISFPSRAEDEQNKLFLEITSDHGPVPIYHEGETMKLFIRSNNTIKLYCFYQAGDNSIVRLFPNIFHTDPTVNAEQDIIIPENGMKFQIRFNHPLSIEAVLCLGSKGRGELPAMLNPDLRPLSIPDLETITQTIRQLDPSVVTASLSVVVLPVGR